MTLIHLVQKYTTRYCRKWKNLTTYLAIFQNELSTRYCRFLYIMSKYIRRFHWNNAFILFYPIFHIAVPTRLITTILQAIRNKRNGKVLVSNNDWMGFPEMLILSPSNPCFVLMKLKITRKFIDWKFLLFQLDVIHYDFLIQTKVMNFAVVYIG